MKANQELESGKYTWTSKYGLSMIKFTFHDRVANEVFAQFELLCALVAKRVCSPTCALVIDNVAPAWPLWELSCGREVWASPSFQLGHGDSRYKLWKKWIRKNTSARLMVSKRHCVIYPQLKVNSSNGRVNNLLWDYFSTSNCQITCTIIGSISLQKQTTLWYCSLSTPKSGWYYYVGLRDQ